MKKKSFLLSTILILLTLIAGTMAWVTFRTKKTAMVLTIGNASDTMVTITPYQVDEVLYPVQHDYEGMKFDIAVANNSPEDRLFGLYFKINDIDSELLSTTFKYNSYNGLANVCTSIDPGSCYGWVAFNNGNFSNALNSNRMYILEDTVPAGETYYYRVYLYIDGEDNNNDIENASANIELRAQLEKIGNYTSILVSDNDDLIYKVHHDEIANTPIIPATDDYRYYGINPNNYVCLDYAGQNTCPDKHLYRIIGIIRNDNGYNYELKLVKASVVVDDNDNSSFLFDVDSRQNIWDNASSNVTVLNGGYLNSTGDFVNSGLSSSAKGLIDEASYYINGTNNSLSDPYYSYYVERGQDLISTRASVSYFGLMYPSDYGYASGITQSEGNCIFNNVNIDDNCTINNWMPRGSYTITPSGNSNIFIVGSSGLVGTAPAGAIPQVLIPVAYLKSNVIITGGIGTISNPYTVSKETLYDVLRNASATPLATAYTGDHKDADGVYEPKTIYHWYGENDNTGLEITNKYNVVFGGYCWQMIRTTDTGGVRLLYNGVPTTGTSHGNTTYYCGPNRFGDYTTTVDLAGSYYFSNSYTVTTEGNYSEFTLDNPTLITIDSSNASTQVASIAANYPYTCMSDTIDDSCDDLYKVVSLSSRTTVNVYESINRDSIATAAYNTNANSISDVGYMYKTRYPVTSTSMAKTSPTLLSTMTITSTYNNYNFASSYTMNGNSHVLTNSQKGNAITGYPQSWQGMYYCTSGTSCTTMYYVAAVDGTTLYRFTISSGKQYDDFKYLIGDTITDNNDGTFTLTGNVQELQPSNYYSVWFSNYSNYNNKWICLPGYYSSSIGPQNDTIYTCGSTSTANNVKALAKITAVTNKSLTYSILYKYGYTYNRGLKTDGNPGSAGSLQYLYNWGSTSTTVTSTIGGIGTSGYKVLTKSHATCLNLSGECNNYNYINYTTSSYIYSAQIPDDTTTNNSQTDTDSMFYKMFYNFSNSPSQAKDIIDDWYEDELETDYEAYVDYTNYCNNRHISNYGSWNPTESTINTNNNLLFDEYTLTNDLSCEDQDIMNETNSVSKIALMSAPEMNLLNNNKARAAGRGYWLMTPYRFTINTSAAQVRTISYLGAFGSFTVNINVISIRPAISLIAGLGYTQGNGRQDNPYVVDAPAISR